MVLYGLVYTWVFIILFLYFKLRIQTEIIIYFAWIAWSISGAFVAINQTSFVNTLMTVFQIGILIFIIAGVTALRQGLSTVMLGIAIGGIIVAISSYYTGEFALASGIEAKTRAAGLTRNANSFAYHLLFVIIAVFYFWQNKTSLLIRVFLSALFTISFLGIIYSGSRKGFMGVLAFLILWFLFCQRKRLLRNPLITLAILFVISVGSYYLADYVMSNTILSRRFQYSELHRASDDRLQMYRDGFDMIKKNPVFGVGLDNFRALSTSGLYSHSDFMEVAANTGIVGFLIYFSIYIVLWQRLNYIQYITDNPHLLNVIGLLKAAILTILLEAIGRPNITSKLTWLFLAGVIGYSYALKGIIKRHD